MTSPRRRAQPILAALAAAILFTVFVFSWVRIHSDIADFLPRGQDPASRFLLQQLRSGDAAGLVLIGIENAPPAELARIDRALSASLAGSGLFGVVAGGQPDPEGPEADFLFRHRYLLSPSVSAQSFTVPALHRDLEDLLKTLQTSAAMLAIRYGQSDPVGAFLAMSQVWVGGSHVRVVDGAWFAADRNRALLVAKLRAGGMDVAAEDRALDAIQAAFQHAVATGDPAARPRLLLSGPAVFARDAAHAIRGDVERLSLISSVLVALLLFWRFRSPLVVAAIAVPVLLSIDLAAIVVQIGFGAVQGLAFGFGMTMLGVTVDYPVLLIGHRKRGEAVAGTWQRIGRTLVLTVAAAAIGLTGMVFAGFPGLAQLGVFSVAGVLAAAGCTRFVLPRLVVAADLTPVAAGDPALLRRVEAWRAHRRWAVAALPVALLVLWLHPPRWQDDLQALSPVPPADLALDRALRGELGVPDAGQVIVLRGNSVDAVLTAEESLAPMLARLRQQGVIGGVEDAARFLPSAATQLERQHGLPDAATLAVRLQAAQQGLPFTPKAFDAFRAAVAETRQMNPVTLDDITAPDLRARLQPMLFQADGAWYGLIAPRDLHDAARLRAALAGSDAMLVDMRGEADTILRDATARAWTWLAIGFAMVVCVLWAGLRDAGRVMRVAGSVASACLVTLALLGLFGARLSLLHIVALQFVAGVGLDYALFFARRRLDEEERARTLRTLITCNAMTLLTFGLLAICQTPVLRQIGTTVAIGALAAMVFAFFFAGAWREAA